MKKKFGFTLAEVLITLGIIGVVAALTAPALVKNSGQAKIGPSLAKFVNTFEVGAEQYMNEESVGVLTDSTEMPIGGLSRHIIMTPFDKTYTFSAGDGSGTYAFNKHEGIKLDNLDGDKVDDTHGSLTGDAANFIKWLMPAAYAAPAPEIPDQEKDLTVDVDDYAFQLKDGTLMSFVSNTKTVALSGKGAYKKIVGLILVDINGPDGPNRAAKDVFAFILDQSGTLIPVGGTAHKHIAAEPSLNTTTQYTDRNATCNPTSDKLIENFACTGKIADNGWKAEY